VQGDLPGIIPPFNYQGCYLELEAKAAEVDALHDEYIDAKEVAADAKKAWDKAAELYTKMALEFRRRRQSKGDDSPSLAEPTSRALACTWDKAHPDEACPFCDTTLTIEQRAAIVRVIGEEILPTEANGHADQVVTYRTKLDVAETVDALAGLVYDVPTATVAEWSPEDRATVRAWLANPDGTFENRPAILGCPHLAEKAGAEATVQACASCGAVLRTWQEGDGSIVWLRAGALVRTDCPGVEDEGHRYPERTPKAKRSRKSAAEPEAEAEAKPAKKRASKKAKK
jgi:hypothetical protein